MAEQVEIYSTDDAATRAAHSEINLLGTETLAPCIAEIRRLGTLENWQKVSVSKASPVGAAPGNGEVAAIRVALDNSVIGFAEVIAWSDANTSVTLLFSAPPDSLDASIVDATVSAARQSLAALSGLSNPPDAGMIASNLSNYRIEQEFRPVLDSEELLVNNFVDQIDPRDLVRAGWQRMCRTSALYVKASAPCQPKGLEGTIDEANGAFEQAYTALVSQLSGRLPPAELAKAAVSGMTEALNDSHSRIRELGYPLFAYGLSVLWQPGFGGGITYEVIRGSPAEKLGFQRGFTPMIDDTNAGEFLGTPAQILPGATAIFDLITRAPLQPQEVYPHFSVQVRPDRIAYVRLYDLPSGDQFASGLRAAVAEASLSEPRGWILDLREDPGGPVAALPAIAAIFGYQGPVAAESERGGKVVSLVASGSAAVNGRPIAVLADYNTNSSAEALAFLLSQSGLGQVIGLRTAGIVSEGQSYLIDNFALTVTTGRLAVGPKKESLEGRGVFPDQFVILGVPVPRTGDDTEVAAAVKYLLAAP